MRAYPLAAHGGVFLAALLLLAGCAEADSDLDPAASNLDQTSPDAASAQDAIGKCLCVPGRSIACDCAGGLKGVQSCNKDCASYAACSCETLDASVVGDGARPLDSSIDAGATDVRTDGGSADGAGGAGRDATTDRMVGPDAISSDAGACKPTSLAEDTCPGKAIQLTGSEAALRTGSVTGNTSSLCADYEGTCSASPAADAVYVVQPDVDGTMNVDLGGKSATAYDAVLYVRSACTASDVEVGCNDSYEPGADKVAVNVAAGKSYYIFVDGYYGNMGPYRVNVSIKPAICGNKVVEGTEECDDGNAVDGDGCTSTCKKEPTPPYDTCPGVEIPLTGSGTSLRTGTVSGATTSLASEYTGNASCSATYAREAVFWVKPNVSGAVTVDLGGSTATAFDSVLYVRSSCDDAMTQVACHDEAGNGSEKVTFAAVANMTYFIFVDGYESSTGTVDKNRGQFRVNVSHMPSICGNGTQESGEECDDSNTQASDGCSPDCKIEPPGALDKCPGQVLSLVQTSSGRAASYSGNTTYLSADYKGTCGGTTSSTEAVFQFDSGSGGKATVSIPKTGTTFDTVLYVRKGACEGANEVACKDASGTGGETLTFDASANTLYWIFVDGYQSNKGTFALEVSVN